MPTACQQHYVDNISNHFLHL